MSSIPDIVTIEAKPSPLEVPLAKTAVLVIDMQNDFAAESGMFARAGIDISLVRRLIGPIRRLLECTRQFEIPTIYLKMGFRPDLTDAGLRTSPNWIKHGALAVGTSMTAPDGRKSRMLVRDTWNTNIVDELYPLPSDIEIYKTRYSGFYETELESVLQDRDIQYLIVTGCTTSVCVESTIRDAMFRDYSCVLLADCTAEPVGNDFSRTNHDASLLIIQALFGWVTESANVINVLTRMRKVDPSHLEPGRK